MRVGRADPPDRPGRGGHQRQSGRPDSRSQPRRPARMWLAPLNDPLLWVLCAPFVLMLVLLMIVGT